MNASMKSVCCFFFLLCYSVVSFSQIQNETDEKDMYSAFHKFFDDEIRRQGIKGNWIFQLDEITGLHTFDMNEDGLKEVLFEFDAIPVEGGGVVYTYSALFLETETDNFVLGDYIETPDTRFVGMEGKFFQFYNKRKDLLERYSFENKKFNKK